jgi:hypothetical protein
MPYLSHGINCTQAVAQALEGWSYHFYDLFDDSNMGGDVGLFDPSVPEVTVKIEEKRPTNITCLTAQPV